MKIVKDQQVKFVTDHGQTLQGIVLDFTSDAVQVASVLGFFVVQHKQILPQITEKKTTCSTDLGWWD